MAPTRNCDTLMRLREIYRVTPLFRFEIVATVKGELWPKDLFLVLSSSQPPNQSGFDFLAHNPKKSTKNGANSRYGKLGTANETHGPRQLIGDVIQ